MLLREKEDSTLDDSVQFDPSDPDVVVEDDGIEKAAVSCLRFFVLFLIVGSTIGAGVASWRFLATQEQEDFNKEVSPVPPTFIPSSSLLRPDSDMH